MDGSPANPGAVAPATAVPDEPFVRAGRILGPGRLSPGVDRLFQADDFDARRPEFVGYERQAHGGSGLLLQPVQWEAARSAPSPRASTPSPSAPATRPPGPPPPPPDAYPPPTRARWCGPSPTPTATAAARPRQ